MSTENTTPQSGGLYLSYSERITWEPGAHIARLDNIEVSMTREFGADENAPKNKPQFAFTFTQMEKVLLPEDDKESFTHYVGKTYGPPNAKATVLINGMLGRTLTKEEVKTFDLLSLVGRYYQVLTTNEQNSKNETVTKVQGVTPLTKKQADELTKFLASPEGKDAFADE